VSGVVYATCADDPPPADGDTFAACTSVVWEPPPSLVPELTLEGAGLIAGAIILLWGIGYVGGVLRRAMR